MITQSHVKSHEVTRSFFKFCVITWYKKGTAFIKLITFCDRLYSTVSENIYFKFTVHVMWEPVPGSTIWNCALWRRLLKLCPLAQRDAPGHSFNGAPGHSFNGGLATLLHESEKIFCVKTYKIGNLTHNLEKTAKCGFRTMNLRTHASVLTTKGTKTEISSGSAYYITKLKNLRKNLRGCGLYNKTWKPSRKPSRRIIGSETRDDGQGMFGQ